MKALRIAEQPDVEWNADMPPAWNVLKDVPAWVLDLCYAQGMDMELLVFARWLVMTKRLSDA